MAGAFQRPDRCPVADDDPFEAPLALERPFQEVVLRHGRSVDAVVCAHHQPRLGLHDGFLEREQIHLTKRAFAHADVEREPLGLAVVRNVVLRSGRDSVVLEPSHVCGCQNGREHRVLAERFEMPAA